MELIAANDIQYAIYSSDRFPNLGYFMGGMRDIAYSAYMMMLPTGDISELVNTMNNSITSAAMHIGNLPEWNRERIALFMHQPPNMQTFRMASLILLNAFIFHKVIEGTEHGRVRIQPVPRKNLTSDLMTNLWDKILEFNYYPIFGIARDIMEHITDEQAGDINTMLSHVAGEVVGTHMVRSSDMYGTLIQKMITDRTLLAAFYTLPESAAMLARLSMPEYGSTEWGNPNFKIADFACGTGTLLTAAYKQLIFSYEISRGSFDGDMHTNMVENNIAGFDVMPSATHLTISSLLGFYPRIRVEGCRVGTIDFGKFVENKNERYGLGSLELFNDETTLDMTAVIMEGDKERRGNLVEIPHNDCDLVIMNPPYTSNTKSVGDMLEMYAAFNMVRKDQAKMNKLGKKIFADTCADGRAGYPTYFAAIANKKIKAGGTVAFVLPSTISFGKGYERVRDMLCLKYDDLLVVSISGAKNGKRAFSSDTSIGEVLLVAKKLPQEKIDAIEHIESEIRKDKKILQNAKNTIKRHEQKKPIRPSSIENGRKALITIHSAPERIRKNMSKLNDTYSAKRARFAMIERSPLTVLTASITGGTIRNMRASRLEDGGGGALP